MTNLENIEELQNLSQEERKVALEILQQFSMSGESKIFEDLKYSDFDEIPVDIETFLKEPKYLGRGLINKEGKFTVFPYWIQMLKKLFPDNLTTAYNTLILTGSIGIGKSFIADIAMLYMLYRMLCLKDPYLYYGLQPIDKITFSFINITLDTAKGVAWDKLQQLVQTSEWFMEHGTLNKSAMNPTWTPNKRIELIVGSRNNHVIGRALFANFTDEANFGIGNDIQKLKKKQRTLISQVDARMQSRFMKGTYLPTLNIIASSKRDQQSFLESYIDLKRKNESKTTLIIDEPQWVIRDDKGSPDDPGSFYVAMGNQFLASELLHPNATENEINDYRRRGYELLKVPAGYYENFLDDVDIALTDIAGKSTINSMKYISGVRLNQAKINTYQNLFIKDIIKVGNAIDDLSAYNDFIDLSRLNRKYISKPLFIHLDMSLSGDKTGIAGVWITGKKPKTEGINSTKELFYRLAFSVSIQAPKGYQVSFEKNRAFIRWLKEQGFAIKGISSDTYQSAQIQQQLKAEGFNTSIISVDRLDPQSKICLPYQYFKSTLYEKRIEIYDKCDLLTDEIIGLERESDGHINHPDNGKSGSKDQSDAVVGALYNASQHGEEFAFDYGETIEQMIEVSSSINIEDKKQVTLAFEDDLKNKFKSNKQEIKQEEAVKKEDKSVFKDFGLGKAKPVNPLYLKDGILYW